MQWKDEEIEVFPKRNFFQRPRLMILCCVLIVFFAFQASQWFSPSVDALLSWLHRHGARVQEISDPPNIFYEFTGTAHPLLINGERVTVFDYKFPLEADKEAWSSPDCGTINGYNIDYSGSGSLDLHFYKSGRLIVEYGGTDLQVLGWLTGFMGTQFMGCG